MIVVSIVYMALSILTMLALAWFFWSLMCCKVDDYALIDYACFEAFIIVLLGLVWPVLLLSIVVLKIDNWRTKRRFKKAVNSKSSII